MHNLSKLNNKSSSCLTPGSFNPLINYKSEDNKGKPKIRRKYITNKDHFNNMTPTQRYVYKPHTKQSMYNYYLISQIDNLPGRSRKEIINLKKTGKKTFYNNIIEEDKRKTRIKKNNNNNNNTNENNKKNNYKITNCSGKISRVYEFDNPIISYRDINNKQKYN